MQVDCPNIFYTSLKQDVWTSHGRKNHGGRGGARAPPPTSKAGELSPPKKDLSVPKLIHVFNGLQCYTCINPMIMVKLTSKGQKSMFERVKNRKKFLGGVSPDPLAALESSSLEEPP